MDAKVMREAGVGEKLTIVRSTSKIDTHIHPPTHRHILFLKGQRYKTNYQPHRNFTGLVTTVLFCSMVHL
jgi:hypothetical protein